MTTREKNARDLASEAARLGTDKQLTAEQLDDVYNPDGDGEHWRYTRGMWVDEVFNQNTLVGYWQWVEKELAEDDD